MFNRFQYGPNVADVPVGTGTSFVPVHKCFSTCLKEIKLHGVWELRAIVNLFSLKCNVQSSRQVVGSRPHLLLPAPTLNDFELEGSEARHIFRGLYRKRMCWTM